MALVVPLASSASVIENILFKVRRGIALSRNATQENPATGVMVDLPEKIDFEMTILKSHQSLDRITGTTSLDYGSDLTTGESVESSVTSKEANASAGKANEEHSEEAVAGSSIEAKSSGTGEESNQSTSESSGGNRSTSESGIDSNKKNQSETGSDSGSKSSQESSSETQSTTTTSNLSGDEQENRCTYQNHNANRAYDKFDTDTGEISAI